MPSDNLSSKNETTQIIKNLPRQQKMAAVFLAAFSILIVVSAAILFNFKLNKPFSTDKKMFSATTATTSDLSKIDSDGDGLSDYDETNIYQTSPYLEDSDSDGLNDKQEIAQGTNPNCPSGKICNAVEVAPVASSSDIGGNIAPIEIPVMSGAAAIVPGIGNEVTPATLRQILLQNGYDQATLDKISDEDIMKSYIEAVQQSSAAASNSGVSNQ